MFGRPLSGLTVNSVDTARIPCFKMLLCRFGRQPIRLVRLDAARVSSSHQNNQIFHFFINSLSWAIKPDPILEASQLSIISSGMTEASSSCWISDMAYVGDTHQYSRRGFGFFITFRFFGGSDPSKSQDSCRTPYRSTSLCLPLLLCSSSLPPLQVAHGIIWLANILSGSRQGAIFLGVIS
jgi:hypothetical protein